MKKRSHFTVCRKLIGLVKPLIMYMILAILLGVAGNLSAAFITILGGYAVLNLLNLSAVSMGTAFLLAGIFAVLRGVLRYGEQSCNHYIAFKLLALLRNQVFRALRRLCPAKLEGKDKGNLISVITSDIELLEVFYAHTISPVAIAFLVSGFMCLFIGQYSWLLALLAASAYLSIGVAVPLFTSRVSGDDGLQLREKSGELSSFMLDSLRGLPEIIQYRKGEERLEQMRGKIRQLAEDEERMKRIGGRNIAVTNGVILLFDLAMLLAAVSLYQSSNLSYDGVLISVLALMSSFGPVVALANLGSTLQNTFAAGNRVLDILEEKPLLEEVTGNHEVIFNGAETTNVTFSYGKELILKDISVSIPMHSVVGITGKSGSGKSTLLKLLMRFFPVQQGEIRISGQEIDRINTENLRQMESFVTQETHLFHDSIANNVKIAKLSATREEIIEACKKASVHEFIEKLPKGYDTPVGELGDSLSGGERQRLGLARAFLHDAPFMLLDEPTSNLDSLNEAVILHSLEQERQGKTIVLISHRQSTMQIADTVYSVQQGRMS